MEVLKIKQLNTVKLKTFARTACGPFSYIPYPNGHKRTIIKSFFVDGEFVIIEKTASKYLKRVLKRELADAIIEDFDYLKSLLMRLDESDLYTIKDTLKNLKFSVNLRYSSENENEESEQSSDE